jgi:hypothetical protein
VEWVALLLRNRVAPETGWLVDFVVFHSLSKQIQEQHRRYGHNQPIP